MFRSSLFVPACCSKWLNVQLARMIGRVEVEVVEVEMVGGRKSQVGGRKVLTGGRKVLAGGRRIQREAQHTLRGIIGRGREAGQAIRLSQLTIDLPVVRGLVKRTGNHVRREMRCFTFGEPLDARGAKGGYRSWALESSAARCSAG